MRCNERQIVLSFSKEWVYLDMMRSSLEKLPERADLWNSFERMEKKLTVEIGGE